MQQGRKRKLPVIKQEHYMNTFQENNQDTISPMKDILHTLLDTCWAQEQIIIVVNTRKNVPKESQVAQQLGLWVSLPRGVRKTAR